MQTHYMQPTTSGRPASNPSTHVDCAAPVDCLSILLRMAGGEQGSQLPLPHALSTHTAAIGASRLRPSTWILQPAKCSPCRLALFDSLFFEALLFLRVASILRFRPGGQPDHRVLSRVSNHSLGQLATNAIPVKHITKKIFALLGRWICNGWLVRLHGRLVLI